MTGMTTDYAIAILRRMQEPEPFEPQINESAFDALEMAIQAIQKYATWSQTYSNMVEDTISRKAVIDAIVTWTVEDRPDVEMPTDLIDRIRNLTSAQPERKTGRIVNPTPYGECSECGYLIDSRDGYNFCPNCGARMVKEGEDNG